MNIEENKIRVNMMACIMFITYSSGRMFSINDQENGTYCTLTLLFITMIIRNIE